MNTSSKVSQINIIPNSPFQFQTFYPQYQYYKMNKCNYMQNKTYNKQKSHINDLNCFQHCTTWTLNLTSAINKVPYYKEVLLGTNTPNNFNNDYQNKQITNVSKFLPIDIRANQRFALDRNQPKLFLCLDFDITNHESRISNVNNDYAAQTFEIELGAMLHGNNVFKDSINFKVKGYDIIKSIHGRLNDKKTSNTLQVNNPSKINIFQTTVFNNIQCTFGVDFIISNFNLSKFYSSPYYNNNSIAVYEIKVVKFRIVYSLPLCVFTYQPMPMMAYPVYNNMLNKRVNNMYYNMSHKRVQIQPIRTNFCNWHSFMSNTTPIVFECEELLIKDIFNSFIKASLFGIDSLYKIDQNHYTKVKYFPTLNSVFVEEKDYSNIMLNSATNINMNNDSSTLDGSFLTNISSTKDEEKPQKTKKTIYWKENIQQTFKKPSYQKQLKNIYEKNIGIDDISINEISSDSYFSILWTPSKTSQPINVNESLKFVDNLNFTSFVVAYQFRNQKIKNSAHFLPVIGVQEQDYYGNIINTTCQQGANECFWFQNKAINSNQFFLEQDFYMNKMNFCFFLENGCNKEI